MMHLEKIFNSFPIIETDRLRLREVFLSDTPALFEVFGDAEAMYYYGDDVPHEHTHQTYMVISELHGFYGFRSSIRWAITLKDGDDTALGTLGFYKFDTAAKRCEIGYELNRKYWRQGIMSEAIHAILHFGFLEIGLNRVEAGIDGGNPPSQALLLSLGFKHEATFRNRLFYKDRYWDEDWFGLLKEDYLE